MQVIGHSQHAPAIDGFWTPHLLTGGYDSCPELATRTTGLATCARRAGSSLKDCMIASMTQAGVLVMPA
jgi:hypothetical protein